MSTTTARYAGVLARASLLPLSMLLPLAALAQGVSGQDAPGMIVIPGNGEPASTSPRTAQPGMQSARCRIDGPSVRPMPMWPSRKRHVMHRS